MQIAETERVYNEKGAYKFVKKKRLMKKAYKIVVEVITFKDKTLYSVKT